ncbi:PREDICTED: uncharacterized protein LOC109174834 [Ipomoea nil]|uniref:uncharacterized protein LOC109174834 n=1 Tax=Ipomoea nil TaxID=35883 RepID=UPI000900D42E|nr:PREDICTED: uncharacterized protein LOC109174834 [Ipomoea nil]
MSTNSSERTITTTAPPSATTSNPLSSAHHFVLIKLTSRNYLFWRTQLVSFLKGQELLGYVDGEIECPPATIASSPSGKSASGVATTTGQVPNPAYRSWVKQDQSILSLLVSSMSDEVLHLAVGRNTAKEVWDSITAALGSSTCARCLNLLGQFQSLRQGNSSPADYIGQTQLLVEALALVGRPLSLDEQNLWVFRGLRPEFRSMAASLTVNGNPVSLPQLADFLQAQEFIYSDELPIANVGGAAGGGPPAALYAGRGRS